MGFGGLLKANTAVDVLIGPFIDDTDGKTAETGLTISQADVKLSKNGQALTQKNDANAATHDANGYYNCPLDTTDTNTEGQLTLIVHESGALPVRLDFQVLAEAAFDSLCAAKDTGYMDINVKAVSEDTTAADDLEVFIEALGTDDKVLISTDAQDLSGTLDVNAKKIGGTTQTGNDIGADVDAILTDTGTTLEGHLTDIKGATFSGATDSLEAIRDRGDAEWVTATGFSSHSAADVADAVWDEASAGHTDAGKAGAQLWTNIDAIDVKVDGLNDISAADVNTQVCDVLKTDTVAEMSQGAPPASPTLEQAINYLYRYLVRNKIKVDATSAICYADNKSTELFKSTLSDDGTDFIRDEMVSGT